MSSKNLWAPWRMEYIEQDSSSDQGCFLCDAGTTGDEVDSLLVHRDERVVVVMNRFPYNNGHVLVAPRSHVAELSDVDDRTRLAMMDCLVRLQEIYRDKMNAEGFNIGINIGRPAGAGLPGHLHVHLVPRWSGDTNFMTVFADVRVIPQHIETTRRILSDELGRSTD